MTDQILFKIADVAANEQIEGIPEEEQHIDIYTICRAHTYNNRQTPYTARVKRQVLVGFQT
jgi:hypothetical protein